MLTNVAGSPTGAARNTNRLTIAKIVAFAATPIPIDITTTATIPGAPTNLRTTYLKSRTHPAIPTPELSPRIGTATHTTTYDSRSQMFPDAQTMSVVSSRPANNLYGVRRLDAAFKVARHSN